MRVVNKTFLLGILATEALAGLIGLIVYGIGVSPDLGALLFVLGLIGTGLIGGEVTRRMPPRPHRQFRPPPH
jgi:hypothetical protein